MALQSSGLISLTDIQNEFGGTNPIGLSEYYGAAAGVPTSGLIGMSDFYGKSSIVETAYTYQLVVGQGSRSTRGGTLYMEGYRNTTYSNDLTWGSGGVDYGSLSSTINHHSGTVVAMIASRSDTTAVPAEVHIADVNQTTSPPLSTSTISKLEVVGVGSWNVNLSGSGQMTEGRSYFQFTGMSNTLFSTYLGQTLTVKLHYDA